MTTFDTPVAPRREFRPAQRLLRAAPLHGSATQRDTRCEGARLRCPRTQRVREIPRHGSRTSTRHQGPGFRWDLDRQGSRRRCRCPSPAPR